MIVIRDCFPGRNQQPGVTRPSKMLPTFPDRLWLAITSAPKDRLRTKDVVSLAPH